LPISFLSARLSESGLFVPCTPTAGTVDGGSRCFTSSANYSRVQEQAKFGATKSTWE
jgi:hypothetical protein